MREIIVPRKAPGFNLYTTGAWCIGPEASPRPPFRGSGWYIGVRRYEFKGAYPSQAEAFQALRGFHPPAGLARGKGRHRSWMSAPELVIFAKSKDAAQRAANLLFVAYLLIQGSSTFLDILVALPDKDPEPEFRHYAYSVQTTGLLKAASLAARLSSRRAWQYAAMKFWFSYRCCGPEPMDFHPGEGIHHGVSGDPFAHVACAQAILSAYGVVEELGLEIRASKEQPAKINGAWNPVVRSDLENRLKKACVNLDEHVNWAVRGAPTRIETKRSVPKVTMASWAFGPIRDRDIDVVDAVSHASWLRSGVSAHRTSRLTTSLTPTDVHNAQMLARRLLLEVTGFWRRL